MSNKNSIDLNHLNERTTELTNKISNYLYGLGATPNQVFDCLLDIQNGNVPYPDGCTPQKHQNEEYEKWAREYYSLTKRAEAYFNGN